MVFKLQPAVDDAPMQRTQQEQLILQEQLQRQSGMSFPEPETGGANIQEAIEQFDAAASGLVIIAERAAQSAARRGDEIDAVIDCIERLRAV